MLRSKAYAIRKFSFTLSSICQKISHENDKTFYKRVKNIFFNLNNYRILSNSVEKLCYF
jgi:hypothetical protein